MVRADPYHWLVLHPLAARVVKSAASLMVGWLSIKTFSRKG
jgi:hypothetical protein